MTPFGVNPRKQGAHTARVAIVAASHPFVGEAQVSASEPSDQNRGNGDGDDKPPRLGRVALRLADLQAAGICGSWAEMGHLMRNEKFPQPIKLGHNTRVWWLHEVDAWLDARPVAPMPDLTPSQKCTRTGRPRGRPRKVPASNSNNIADMQESGSSSATSACSGFSASWRRKEPCTSDVDFFHQYGGLKRQSR
jgi:hypothetical protein